MQGNNERVLTKDSSDQDIVSWISEDSEHDLLGKIQRVRKLIELNETIGKNGSIPTGAPISNYLWNEARSCFINGDFIATILSCQSLCEHLLASYLEYQSRDETLASKPRFRAVIKKCHELKIISDKDKTNLEELSDFRNLLTHYRSMKSMSAFIHQALEREVTSPVEIIVEDAHKAMTIAFQIISLPVFRID